jgi:DNA-binding HxlR family transcriptional regulator
MNASDKILAAMPKLAARREDVLLENVIDCRWTVSVLRAVAGGVRRPGALERHIDGISPKVLTIGCVTSPAPESSSVCSSPEIPPRVEYQLTDFGKKFLVLLKGIEKLQRELIADAER